MSREYHAGNQHAWNQAAAAYKKKQKKTVEFLRGGGVSMCAPELPFLSNLGAWCNLAVHLQCAGGEDTLSLLNLGAKKVIGVDISDEMLSVAREVSKELQAPATWLCSDILDLPTALNDSADLVYTGRGAINWIHDLDGWARSVRRLLRVGGRFYMFEGHPITYLFDPKASEIKPDSDFSGYFSEKVYASKGWTAEYVGALDVPLSETAEKYERVWPVCDVLNALLAQGLKLHRFEEHPDAYWTEFPNLPEQERRRFPNTYSLLMYRD